MPYSFIRDVPFNEEQHAEIRSLIGVETPKGLITHLAIRHDAWPALHRRLGRSGGFGEFPRRTGITGRSEDAGHSRPLAAVGSHSPWK